MLKYRDRGRVQPIVLLKEIGRAIGERVADRVTNAHVLPSGSRLLLAFTKIIT